MKKTVKIVVMVVLTMVVVMTSTNVFAFNASSIISNIGAAANAAANNSANATAGLNSIAGNVIALIRNVAVIAGVILLSVLGIKFMLGSAEEKAEYKKSLIPLVVGIVVVMAATQVVSMIFGFFG